MRTKRKKKISIIISVLLAVLVMTSVAVYVAHGEEGYRTIIVTEVSGDVSVVKDDIEYEAYPGMHLREGYVVVTSVNSYVRMVLDDDKYVKIESGSRAIFETLGRVGSGKTVIKMERGSITSEIVSPLQENEEFFINTPNALLAVRGTYFRVDISTTKEGDKNTDVYTYGGCVASKRIKPDGKIVEEDVKVEAGYKVKVNMDEKDTIYVVDEAVVEAFDVTDVPDEDLVDMYFASSNGHEMFVKTEDIKKNIEDREIDIDDYVPVYDVAKDVISEDDTHTKNEVNPENAPDDKHSKKDKDKDKSEDEDYVVGAPTDGVHVHNKVTAVVQPGCTSVGSIVVECDRCEKLLSNKEIPAKGHRPGDAVVVHDATCTATGISRVSCMECREMVSESVIPAKGHTEKVETVNGKIKVSCGVCGVVIKETQLPSTQHKEKVTTVAATCTTPGKVTVSCQECGVIIKEVIIPATGHKEETTKVYPTCTDPGKTTVSCTTCGKLVSEQTIAATGHKVTEEKVYPTLATEGAHREYCSVCNVTLGTTVIPKLTYLTAIGGDIVITATGYKKGNMATEIPYTGSYTIKQGTNKSTSCTITVESGTHNIILAGVNLDGGGLKIAKGAKVTLNGAGANIISCANGIVNNGTLDIVGGSFKLASNTITNGSDQIKCTVYGALPDKSELVFTKSNGSTFVYNVTTADKATDGKYYVWRLDYGLAVNETNFPDAVMRRYILAYYDTNGNGRLSDAELAAAMEMNLTGQVTSLKGIELLTSLVSLNVSGISTLTTIDISACKSLSEISANGCSGLTSLVTKGCSELKYIDVSNCTKLTTVDVSANTQLRYLYCCGNTSMTGLDVSKNTELILLDACGAKFSSLNLNNCTKLKTVVLSRCANIKSLDVSKLAALETYDVSYSAISSIKLDYNTSIKTIIATNCASLTSVSVKGCTSLTKLDVSGCTALTDVDTTGCTALTTE